MFDTSIASKIIRSRDENVRRHYRVAAEQGRAMAISSVVYHELQYGALRAPDPERNLMRLSDFLTGIDGIEPFTAEDGEVAGSIRAELARRGDMIGPFDLLIGAHALRMGATIVTCNVREFSRVPGLVWADWTAA